MNICYKIPTHLRDQSLYEQLKAKAETNYADKISEHLIVPKKSGRCIFVQRGTNSVKMRLNIGREKQYIPLCKNSRYAYYR